MGNSLVVKQPYIIDDYPSDDDDFDDENYSYESAYEGLDTLDNGGPEEEQNLLPEAQQRTTHGDADSLQRETTHDDEKEVPQVTSGYESGGKTAVVSDGEWTPEELETLVKLDEDLNQFEEDETQIITSELEPQWPNKEKSAIPTFRPSSSKGAVIVEEDANGSPLNEDKTFVPVSVIQKQTRGRVSAIPRFSTSSSLEERSPAPSVSDDGEEHNMPTTQRAVESEFKAEKQDVVESSVKESIESSPADAQCPEQDAEEISPVSREIKVVIEGQNSEDDLITVMDTSAWEINISDFSGRAKKNKKRSGIPSLWTDQSTKTASKTSLETAPKSQTSPSALPPSPETTVASTQSPTPRVTPSSSVVASPAADLVLDGTNPSHRKIFDLKRWMCISRPQYKASCGMSSVVSCWNLLFSTLGHGSLSPLHQEEAMKIVGFKAPYEKIKFGPFTGNLMLLKWFRELCNHFKVRGRCYIMFKPNGKNKTIGVTDKMALEKLKAGLQDPGTTFVYHCHNHYFCPIGFEESPRSPREAYSGKVPSQSIEHTWVLIGDTSRKHGPFHCKSWESICQDLHLNSPEYINIRKQWLGVMKREKSRKSSGNLHCIMCFQRPRDLQSFIPTTQVKSNIPRSSRLPRRSPSPSTRKNGEGEFRFTREDRETETDEDWDEDVENLTSDVSSDEDINKRV